MLVSMKEVLEHAKAEQYGVPAPNIADIHTLRACIEAAEETKSPLIIDFAERIGFEEDFPMLINTIQRSALPFALNLDHGKTFQGIINAIHRGFSSVMIDRSMLPFEENVEQTREITRIAHACGVSVEAELGHVGQGRDYSVDGTRALTDPQEAKRFVELTEVDCLAVAVGTAHGAYRGTPVIQFERLEQIQKAVDIPLVLHGGSGTGMRNLQRAIQLGVCKINLGTDLRMGAFTAIKEYVQQAKNPQFNECYQALKTGYKAKLVQYIQGFGACGRAQ